MYVNNGKYSYTNNGRRPHELATLGMDWSDGDYPYKDLSRILKSLGELNNFPEREARIYCKGIEKKNG